MNRLASLLVYLALFGIFLSLGTPISLLVLTLELLIFLIFVLLLTHQLLDAWPDNPWDPVGLGLLGITGLILLQPLFLEIADKNSYLLALLRTGSAFALYTSIKILFRTRDKIHPLVQYLIGLSALFGFGILLQTFLAGEGRPENIQQSFLAYLPRPVTLWTARTVDPNNAVDLFFSGTFLALGLLLYTLERKRDRDLPSEEARHQILWYGLFSALLLAGIFFSYSRGGILAFVAGLGLLLLLLLFRRGPGRVRLSLTAFGVLLFFLVTLDLGKVFEELATVGEMFAGKDFLETQAGLRWEGPVVALHLLKKLWLLGGGAGNLTAAWFAHHPPELQVVPYALYNDSLQIAVECGVPVLLVVLGMAVWLAKVLLRRIFQTRSRWEFYLGSALLAATLAFAAHSLIDPTFLVEPLLWLSMVGIALGVNVGPEKLSAVPRPWLRIACSLLLVGTLGGMTLAGRKMGAQLAAHFGGVGSYPLAARLDPWNSYFDTQLTSFYRNEYRERGDRTLLEKALETADRALQKSPFVPQFYAVKAQLLYRLGRTEKLDSLFRSMQKRFPNHYEQFLVPAVFYLEKAVESKDRRERAEFTRKGLAAYRQAVKSLSKILGTNYFEYYRVYLEDPFNLDLVRELLRKHGIPESGPFP